MAERKKKAGKSKNGNKKHGRNKAWCEAYKRRGMREKNKLFRLISHCLRDQWAHDVVATLALRRYDRLVHGRETIAV